VHYPDGKSRKFGPGKPYFDMKINHPRVFRAILRNPTLGVGESYMNGSLELIGDIAAPGRLVAENATMFNSLPTFTKPLEKNSRTKQRSQIARHYDLGNEFYKLWLDESMTYSCAYFHHETDKLETAQNQKVDYILRKLQLQKGQSVLDIGCGWGKLLIAAAEQYGASGHGITLSEEQYKLANERIKAAGLSDKITVELLNYQDLALRDIKFDRVVSVGMYEHVGQGNHATYFKAVDKLLKDDGLSVLHTISSPSGQPPDAWTASYIFPGGFIPTVHDTVKIMESGPFELKDYENLRFHYAMTLDEWLRRFENHKDEVIKRYGIEFYRMWRLYLGSSISGFRYGDLSLSQFVFTKGAHPGYPLTREYLYS
jgi:cyclopropane-fatty-acyl-phospholipid synthase